MVTINILNTSTNPDPEYKHENDAGFDLYSNENMTIGEGETVLVDVGLRVDIPPGFEGQIRLRSSYAKLGIVIPNAPGTIDSGYKGPVMVAVRNLNAVQPFIIEKGERFAQMVIGKIPSVILNPVDKDTFFKEKTSRDEGGFGSTGNR
jgi:dUTP pyrophosphatase|tara:strand:- start:692 stop:1135 length:444 start_codon:yes stop_codon:yes gene_type:complete